MAKFVVGGLVYGTAMYSGYMLYKLHLKQELHPSDPLKQQNVTQNWNSIGDYDSKIELDEWLLGMNSKRRNLVSRAQGKVLEVSCGTGRNLDFYEPKKISHLTLADASLNMLKTAFEKQKGRMKAECVKMNAEQLLFPPESFDTVVDTFGLCSHADPVKALEEMKRVLTKHGQILLLEHGRSFYWIDSVRHWINTALDKTALDHAQKWGCWYNRDIVSMAQSAGMEIVEMEMFHFGTTYQIVLRKKQQ
ncbi:S-adenosyl-L-methionine-dependent methyltransferase [Gorgonomyces haynaldii]|nr:S-adenosyl-L-methionine-dependent methyltransferase [Gorgonomyces haynaldii]